MYQHSLAHFTSTDGTTRVEGRLAEPDRYRLLFDRQCDGPVIARGAGLSYVAASMGDGVLSVGMRHFSRLLGFDAENGVVEVEAGATLADVLRFLLPKGFILPVMPGHPMITVGGCIAADVHGKNPVRDGTFRDHLLSLDLWHAKLGLRRFEAGSTAFEASCGGYGLTGIIVSARLKARRLAGRLARMALTPVSGFDEAHAILRERSPDADLVYSWHNWKSSSSASGFVIQGTILPSQQNDTLGPVAPLTPGKGLPLINRATIPLFNAAYGLKLLRQRGQVAPLAHLLFPLAKMGFYFRLYGNGFLEHQVLVPHDKWSAYWPLLGRLLQDHGVRPVVTSLKMFGGRRKAMGFDGDGVALTINVVNEPRSITLFEALDKVDCDIGAVANAVKDSRLGAEAFRHQTPWLQDFLTERAVLDPDRSFQSALSRRLAL